MKVNILLMNFFSLFFFTVNAHEGSNFVHNDSNHIHLSKHLSRLDYSLLELAIEIKDSISLKISRDQINLSEVKLTKFSKESIAFEAKLNNRLKQFDCERIYPTAMGIKGFKYNLFYKTYLLYAGAFEDQINLLSRYHPDLKKKITVNITNCSMEGSDYMESFHLEFDITELNMELFE